MRSDSPYEEQFGFSRAVRFSGRVLVSGTAPIWPDGEVDPDPAVQARRCFEIIGHALQGLGTSFADVVRTRMYLTSTADADAVGAVHGEIFRQNPPAASMLFIAALVDPRWKVEIEAEAVIPLPSES